MQYGRTPLHLAASNGSLEVVRRLCLAGVNIDAVTTVSPNIHFPLTAAADITMHLRAQPK